MATDALVLWGLFLLIAVAAMVTYARLPARELYQVSNPGIDTGIRRGLAFAGFPVAPVAVVWLLAEHLTRRVVTVAAVAATVLASSVFWPGAVDEADPDARPISVLALVAVVAVIALTVGVARSAGFRRPRLRLREERVRLFVFGLIFLVEIPWLACQLGHRHPLPQLAAEFELSRSQARDRVHKARTKHYLTPGDRGRATATIGPALAVLAWTPPIPPAEPPLS